MRFALLFILLGIITNAKPVHDPAFVPSNYYVKADIDTFNKIEFFEYLTSSYSSIDSNGMRDIKVFFFLKNSPNMAHLNYLLQGLKRYEIPERIGIRWVYQESRFDSIAFNDESRAFGYCQIIPATWKELSEKLGFKHHTPINNIEAGMFYLKQQYDTFGRWDLALAAYNSGPNRPCLYQGRVPRIYETQEYVKFILK